MSVPSDLPLRPTDRSRGSGPAVLWSVHGGTQDCGFLTTKGRVRGVSGKSMGLAGVCSVAVSVSAGRDEVKVQRYVLSYLGILVPS